MTNGADDTRAIRIRAATGADREFILSLAPRLVEFGPPPWRDRQGMMAVDCSVWSEALDGPTDDAALFVAEDASGIRLGFLHVVSGHDYYQHTPHAHVADLIVAPGADGRGVGSRLIAVAEEWARARGCRWLTLNVFAENVRARALYERLGFGADMTKYVKVLD